MNMRGDELVSLLGGYVSSLEELVVQEDVSSTDRLSSLAAQFGRYGLTGGDEGDPRSVVSGLYSGSTSAGATPKLESFGEAMAASTLAMTSGWNASNGREVASSLDGLVGGERLAPNLAASFSGGIISSSMSSLLDVFRSAAANSQTDDLENQRYAWQSPSRSVEGLVDRGSRLASVDSAFDGSLRVVERGHPTAARIDVRIEALDARSFLERKEDIAEAVRQAMLTSGTLGAALNEY